MRPAGEMADPRSALGSKLNSASFSLYNFACVAASQSLMSETRVLVFPLGLLPEAYRKPLVATLTVGPLQADPGV